MNKLRRFLPDALIVLLLFGVPLIFFWQQTIGGRTVIPTENLFQWQPYKALADQYHVGEVHNALVSDLILQYYTWRHYALTQISQGQIPLWQPNILAGAPFLGAGQPQMVYPLSLIYLISPLWLAFGWYVAIHVGLAGLNVYILSRALRLRRAGGVIAALTYQLSGFILATVAFPTILGAAAWLPLGLAMIERMMSEEPQPGAKGLAALRGRTFLWVIAGALALGMASLAGHVEAMYFSVLVMCFFGGWRLLMSLNGHRSGDSGAYDRTPLREEPTYGGGGGGSGDSGLTPDPSPQTWRGETGETAEAEFGGSGDSGLTPDPSPRTWRGETGEKIAPRPEHPGSLRSGLAMPGLRGETGETAEAEFGGSGDSSLTPDPSPRTWRGETGETAEAEFGGSGDSGLTPDPSPRTWRGETGFLTGIDWRTLIQRGVWLGAMIGLGLALGAAQIVPAYEMATRSFREGTVAISQVREWAYPPRQILAFLMPNFFGNPTHHQIFDLFTWTWVPVTANAAGDPITTTEWGIKNYVEGAAYIGILPLALAALGVVGWVRSRRRRDGADAGATPGDISPRLQSDMSTSPERGASKVDRETFGQTSDIAVSDHNIQPASPLGFIVLALLSLSFVFGTPTYNLLYYGLPFFNQSHSPFRWVWPFTLCMAVLAGYGVHYLAESLEEPSTDRRAIPARLTRSLGIGGVVIGLATVAALVVMRLDYGAFAGLVDSIFHRMALAPNAFADGRAFFSYEAVNVGILGVMVAASGGVMVLATKYGATRQFGTWRPRRAGEPAMSLPISLWQAAAGLLIIVDLFIGSWGLTPASDPALLAVTPPSIQWLQAQQASAPGQPAEPFRFMAYIAPGSTKTMNANTGWLNGLEDVSGYDSLIPGQYVNYMKLIMPQGDLPYNRVAPIYAEQASALDSPLLDLLGVKYVMSETPISDPTWKQVYQDSALRIYENSQVMPRAFTMPGSAARLISGKQFGKLTQQDDVRQFVLVDGACLLRACPVEGIAQKADGPATPGPAAITVYKSGETWIDAEMKTGGWLVVADSYYPGWRAWVRPLGGAESEEKEVPIYLVDGNFKGVRLEAGRWTVRMKYSPDSVKFGLLGAMLSGLALIFLLGVWAWPHLYREEGSGGEARRVAKNALTPILLNLFTKGISFALTFVSLRVLGPTGAGDYTYAVVIWGWFDIVTNFGLNTYLTREVARHKDQAGRILASTTLARLGFAVAGIPALAGFIAFRQAAGQVPLNNETVTTLWLLYGGLFFSTMSYGLTALFYAFEKAEYPAAIQTISAFLTAGLGISALLIGFGIVGLAATSIVVNVVTFVILGGLAVSMFGLKPSLSGLRTLGAMLADIRAAIGEAWPLMINNLLATLFFRIDVVLLEFLKGATVVGWYRVVYTWVDAIGVIPSFFTLSLFPVMSRQAATDRPALKRAYVLAIKLMTLISIPTAIFTTLLATVLVNILGGAQYLPHGAIALQIFIWAMIIGWMNSVTQYVIIALNRQRTLTIAFIIGAAFNVTANLIFIPAYSYVASSVITIFSEAMLWGVFFVILSKELGRINWVSALWRIFAAGVVCAGVSFGLGMISPWLGLIGGVIAYGGMLALIRPLDAEESRLFAGLLPEGIRRRVGMGTQAAEAGQ